MFLERAGSGQCAGGRRGGVVSRGADESGPLGDDDGLDAESIEELADQAAAEPALFWARH